MDSLCLGRTVSKPCEEPYPTGRRNTKSSYTANLSAVIRGESEMWQFSFNVLPKPPEVLTKGRKRELFNWLFDHKATHPERLTRARRDRYVGCYTRAGGMSQGFAYYQPSASQNVAFGKTKLQMPVLTLDGQGGLDSNMRKSLEASASNVQGGQIDDCGHYVMEEQPENVAQKLLDFTMLKRHIDIGTNLWSIIAADKV